MDTSQMMESQVVRILDVQELMALKITDVEETA